jgi:hypothetical protein
VAELKRDLGAAVSMNVLDDAPPRLDVGVLVDPGAARGDAAVGGDVGHLREDEPGTARGARAEMDEVEVVRTPVLRDVHAHR